VVKIFVFLDLAKTISFLDGHKPTETTSAKGSAKNNLAELAPRFMLGFFDPIEQNHRNSSIISRILGVRSGER